MRADVATHMWEGKKNIRLDGLCEAYSQQKLRQTGVRA